MIGRRVPGEQGQGGVHLRVDGRWEARLSLGWARGRRIMKSFFGHSRDEVERKLEQAKQKLAKGIPLTTHRRPKAPLYARLPKVSGQIATTTELNGAVQQRILDGVTIGLYPEQAATLAGVTVETFNNWNEQARKAAEPYATLVHAIAATEVKHEAQLLQVVNEAGIVDPRMALKLLELRYPARWAPPSAQKDEDAFQQAFAIHIHLSHQEGDGPACDLHHSHTRECFGYPPTIVPAYSDVTPPPDRSSSHTPPESEAAPQDGPAPGFTRVPILRPEKKRPQNGGNGDPENWN